MMDPASPTPIRPDVPAKLWIDQPDVAAYVAGQSAGRMEDALDGMPLVAGGIGLAMFGALMTKRGRGMILGMIPGPWGLALRALNEMTPDERRKAPAKMDKSSIFPEDCGKMPSDDQPALVRIERT